jgi:predicted DNA-binding transcriptional regulator YafY
VIHPAYSPATRLLTLLDLLQSHPRLSAEQLAGTLGVTTRSARRYITMLQDMGIPVEARRGRYGGYALRPGYKLPPLMLTDDEALAITLGLLATPHLGVPEIRAATTGALAKLERVLPIETRERVQAISGAVVFDTPVATGEESPARLDFITRCSDAARRSLRLRMVYQRDDGAQTERLFDCFGVVHHAKRWYAVGFCHLRQDMRVFRLDRVCALEPCDERFLRPADFDCLAYAVASFAAIPERWLVEALLDTSFAEACRMAPPDFATLEEMPVGVALRAYDNSLEHAARFLIALGCPFQVVGPPELLQALERVAAAISAIVAQGLRVRL